MGCGIVTILDISSVEQTENIHITNTKGVVANFVAHSEVIVAMSWDSSDSLPVTSFHDIFPGAEQPPDQWLTHRPATKHCTLHLSRVPPPPLLPIYVAFAIQLNSGYASPGPWILIIYSNIE